MKFSKREIVADNDPSCVCGCKLRDHYFAGTPEEFCKFCAPDCMKYRPQVEKKADELGEPIKPYPPEAEGKQEISIYHPAYEFLVKLIKLLSKAIPEAIPEIKQISQSSNFKTVDDIGDLTAKIWTLATTKYNVPREWLIKNLPEKKIKGSLVQASNFNNIVNKYYKEHWKEGMDCAEDSLALQKVLDSNGYKAEQVSGFYSDEQNIKPVSHDWLMVGNKIVDVTHHQFGDPDWLVTDMNDKRYQLPNTSKKADLWPAQEASEVTLTQSPGAIAYNNPKDTSVSGPNPNDVVDEDKLWDIVSDQFFGQHLRWSEVIKSIRSVYPNVTDSVILSLKDRVKKSLDNQMGMIGSKKVATSSLNTFHWWLSPDGALYEVPPGETHLDWAIEKADSLGIDIGDVGEELTDDSDLGEAYSYVLDEMVEKGWIRLAIPPAQNEIIIELNNVNSQASVLDNFIIEHPVARIWISFQSGKHKIVDYDNAIKYGIVKATQRSKEAKRHLNMDQVIKILDSKDSNKVDHINFIDNTIELLDGSVLTFDDATKRAVELDKEGTFSGSEFSTTDWNVNPTLDLGPFSSPADQGATNQKKPFPNTMWDVATDDEDETQPSSNVAGSLKVGHCGSCSPLKFESIKRFSDFKDKHPELKLDQVLASLAATSPEKDISNFLKTFEEGLKLIEADPKLKGTDEHRDLAQVFFSLSEIQKHLEEGTFKVAFSKKEIHKQANPLNLIDAMKNAYGSVLNYQLEKTPLTEKFLEKQMREQIYIVCNILKEQLSSKQVVNLANKDYFIKNYLESILPEINEVISGIDTIDAQALTVAISQIKQELHYTVQSHPEFNSILGNVVDAFNSFRFDKFASKKQADVKGSIINEILKSLEESGRVNYSLTKGNVTTTTQEGTSILNSLKVIEGPVDFEEIENYIDLNEELLKDSNNYFRAWIKEGKIYFDIFRMEPIRSFSKQELKLVKIAEESELPEEYQNQIAAKWCPAMNLALQNYKQAVTNGHEPQRAFDYALQSISNIDSSIKESDLREAINTYLVPVK